MSGILEAFDAARRSGKDVEEIRVGRRMLTALGGKLGRGDPGLPCSQPGVDDQGLGPNHVYWAGRTVTEDRALADDEVRIRFTDGALSGRAVR